MAKTDADSRPVRESQAVMSELMMPNMANNHGNVFGGVILSLVDRIGAVAAIRHARRPCVTVSMDRVAFLEPIRLGELVTAKASVNFVGRTSMEVGVKVEAENLLTGNLRHTNSCHVTYVAIDDKGGPVPVAGLIPETEEEKARYQRAEERRRRRLEEER
jgi:uncharacterized protein (TIGR00369 family)